MFGLEDQKKKKKEIPDFLFELEKDMKDPKRRRIVKENVEKKIASIKELLRGGEEKDDYDKYGVMLHGYTSVAKVMSRFK